MLLEPVPNRACGPCNVCCKVPTIIEPTLKKPPGVICPNWAQDTGCTIYEHRPGPCRSHFCAWRRIEQLDDSWRPDICNIYAEVKTDPPERFRDVLPDASFALKFTVLGALPRERLDILIATAATLIASDVPVILAVSAPPGHMGGYMLLNPALKPLTADLGMPFKQRFEQELRRLMEIPPRLVPLE